MGSDLPSYKVNDGALNFLGSTALAIRRIKGSCWSSSSELFLLRLCLIRGLSSEQLVVSGRPFFLGSGDNESESLSVPCCRAQGHRTPALRGRSGSWHAICLDFATSKAKS